MENRKKLERLINCVPKLDSTFSDEYVAQVLEEEAKKRAKLSKQYGVAAYQMDIRDKRRDINKTYLSHTIRSMENHNKRQEESHCYRQQRLERQDQRRRISIPDRKEEEVSRTYWGEKKAQKRKIALMAVESVHSIDNAPDFGDETNSFSSDSDRRKKKKAKLDKKAKKERKKKKKKKKDKLR